MEADSDVVYFNGSTLVDAKQNGISIAPSADSQNDWTVTQNDVNIGTGVRTITATRVFNSTDVTDYDFVYSNSSIGLALARGNSASFALANHGFNNRIIDTNVTFTTLGVEDFSLDATSIYPNPSNGNFSIISKTTIDQVSIYTLTGSFVKTVKANENSTQINIEGLSTGVYLIELQNDSQKAWKKVIVE